MKIDQLKWNGGKGLEDLSAHGIVPVTALAKHLADILEQNRDVGIETRGALMETIIDRLESVGQCLNRFGAELDRAKAA